MQANSNITSHTQKRREEIRAKRILEVKDMTNKVAKKKSLKKFNQRVQPSAVVFQRREVTTSQKLNFVQLWDSLAYEIPKISPSMYIGPPNRERKKPSVKWPLQI